MHFAYVHHLCLPTEMRAEGHALEICTSSLTTEMSVGVARHSEYDATHEPNASYNWFPVVDRGDKASQPLGTCFFFLSLSLVKLEVINTHKYNVLTSIM